MISAILSTARDALVQRLMQRPTALSEDNQKRLRDLVHRLSGELAHFRQHPEAELTRTPPTTINVNERGDFPAGRE